MEISQKNLYKLLKVKTLKNTVEQYKNRESFTPTLQQKTKSKVEEIIKFLPNSIYGNKGHGGSNKLEGVSGTHAKDMYNIRYHSNNKKYWDIFFTETNANKQTAVDLLITTLTKDIEFEGINNWSLEKWEAYFKKNSTNADSVGGLESGEYNAIKLFKIEFLLQLHKLENDLGIPHHFKSIRIGESGELIKYLAKSWSNNSNRHPTGYGSNRSYNPATKKWVTGREYNVVNWGLKDPRLPGKCENSDQREYCEETEKMIKQQKKYMEQGDLITAENKFKQIAPHEHLRKNFDMEKGRSVKYHFTQAMKCKVAHLELARATKANQDKTIGQTAVDKCNKGENPGNFFIESERQARRQQAQQSRQQPRQQSRSSTGPNSGRCKSMQRTIDRFKKQNRTVPTGYQRHYDRLCGGDEPKPAQPKPVPKPAPQPKPVPAQPKPAPKPQQPTPAAPTKPGCFVYSNDTCPKQGFNTQGKWHHDVWGEQHQKAAESDALCKKRVGEYNGWCGGQKDFIHKWNKPAPKPQPVQPKPQPVQPKPAPQPKQPVEEPEPEPQKPQALPDILIQPKLPLSEAEEKKPLVIDGINQSEEPEIQEEESKINIQTSKTTVEKEEVEESNEVASSGITELTPEQEDSDEDSEEDSEKMKEQGKPEEQGFFAFLFGWLFFIVKIIIVLSIIFTILYFFVIKKKSNKS